MRFMHCLDLTLADPAANLALDEALLLRAEDGGGEVLRIWEERSPVVVLGSGGVVADDVDEAACAVDGVPILRRSSGGGTVLLGAGCLLFTLVLRYDRAAELAGIQSSYEYILNRIGRALFGAAAELAGVSDLAVDGRKFSGNAQQRKRGHLLHHGTLLYAFDVTRVGRYLLPPPRQPEYRAARAHCDFLKNLELTADELKRRLRGAWQAAGTATDWPTAEVKRLVAEKYSGAGWNRRR
jgi:lipoate-protein ligase A